MYETPYDRFGMLGYQIWRAARLVVDTGVHAKGWTREQAMDYLREYTALPEREIGTEVDRYIAWPGQALSYYLGERAILEDRARAEKALGERFNLRAFHDTVLELGSVPLPVLRAQTDQFIASGQSVQPSSDVHQMLAQVRAPLLSVLHESPDFRPAYDPLLMMATCSLVVRPRFKTVVAGARRSSSTSRTSRADGTRSTGR